MKTMKTIPVKISWELIFLLIMIFFIPIRNSFLHPESPATFILMGAVFFILYVIFSIRYFIKDDFLYIKNGFFGTTKINIHDISSVKKTWNMLSSPAPALERRQQQYHLTKSLYRIQTYSARD